MNLWLIGYDCQRLFEITTGEVVVIFHIKYSVYLRQGNHQLKRSYIYYHRREESIFVTPIIIKNTT
jgi:hypothetical protein